MANLPTRNFNPGDLRNTKTGEFNRYNTPEEGYNALVNDLNVKMSGKSTTGVTPDSDLSHFSSIYAPASDKNDPTSYANNLASQLGVPVTTKIKDLQPRVHDFARAIAKNEGYQGPDSMVAGTEVSTPEVQPITDNTQPTQPITYTDNEIQQNIDAMEQQGASHDEVQEWLNSINKSTTNPAAAIANGTVDNLSKPETKQHIADMFLNGSSQKDVQDYIQGIKNGSIKPDASKQEEPGYFSQLAQQFTEGGKHIVSSIEKGAEKLNEGSAQMNQDGLGNHLEGLTKMVQGGAQSFLGTVAGGLQTAFAPVTPLIQKVVSDAAKQHPDIANSISNAVKPLDELAQKYPEDASIITDGINGLLAAFGEKIGGKNIKGPEFNKVSSDINLPKTSVGVNISSEDLSNSLTKPGRNYLKSNPEFIKTLQEEGANPDIITNNKGNRVFNVEAADEHLSNKISEIEDRELIPLVASGELDDSVTIDLNKYREIAKSNAVENLKSTEPIDNYFDRIEKRYGNNPTAHDMLMAKRQVSKNITDAGFANPNASTDKLVRSALQQSTEDWAADSNLPNIHDINARMGKLIKARKGLDYLDGKPAPLKGWSKFKSNNPIKAKIITHGAEAAGLGLGVKGLEMLSK